MEDISAILYGAIALLESPLVLSCLVVILLVVYITPRRPLAVPPGPPVRVPILGNLGAFAGDTRISFTELWKEYGDVFSLCVGSELVVVINGFEAIKEAFVKRGEEFSYRPKSFVSEEVTKGHGITSSNGHWWKTQRKFGIRTLSSFGFGRSILEHRIHKEISIFLAELAKNETKPFDIEPYTRTSVCNVISALAFGGHFDHGDPKMAKLLELLSENVKHSGFVALVNFIPWMKYLPKMKHLLDNSQQIRGFIRRVVEEHIDSYDENHIEDFTAAFIKEMKAESDNPETTFTVEQLVHTVSDLFGAGTDTSAGVLRWSVLYLINYPDVQTKLQTEIDRHVDRTRLPSLEDKQHVIYTEAFIMEVLRHAVIAVTGASHTVLQNTWFMGHLIPKGAKIFANISSVFLDDEVWDNPKEFNPERFLAEDGSLIKPEEFIPFSVGIRDCMGQSLAKIEIFLFLSAMIQRFHFRPPDGAGTRLETLDGHFGFVHVPKPFEIIAEPRYGWTGNALVKQYKL